MPAAILVNASNVLTLSNLISSGIVAPLITPAAFPKMAPDYKAVEPETKTALKQSIKKDRSLSQLPMIKQGRLSVMNIDSNSWKKINKMGSI